MNAREAALLLQGDARDQAQFARRQVGDYGAFGDCCWHTPAELALFQRTSAVLYAAAREAYWWATEWPELDEFGEPKS